MNFFLKKSILICLLFFLSTISIPIKTNSATSDVRVDVVLYECYDGIDNDSDIPSADRDDCNNFVSPPDSNPSKSVCKKCAVR